MFSFTGAADSKAWFGATQTSCDIKITQKPSIPDTDVGKTDIIDIRCRTLKEKRAYEAIKSEVTRRRRRDRAKLITTLMDYSIHPNIISAIANIYCGDSTNLIINGEKLAEVDITSGIKQGCNGSTVLFLMITYVIIQKLQQENLGFKKQFNIPALFYADDGLIFSTSPEEARPSKLPTNVDYP